MKRLLSLFDSTGAWSRPFRQAGWDVIQIDLDHGHDINDFCCESLIEEFGIFDNGPIDAIMSATPCTDWTNSGARWWKDKDADGRTAAALELHLQTYRTVEFVKPDWWVLENPVGRLPKLGFGPYRDIWDPADFGGWTDLGQDPEALEELAQLRGRTDYENFTEEQIELTRHANAYTKKTCLWGDFAIAERRPIEPVRVCKAGSWLMRLGGKGDGTKAARSATPEGFAKAFFEANKDHAPHRCPTCKGQGQIEIPGRIGWHDCPADCDEGRNWDAQDSLFVNLCTEPREQQQELAL